MAGAGVTVPIHGDTRPLERDIRRATSRRVKLGGIDSRSYTAPLGRIKGAMGEFQSSLDASNARVLAFAASAGAMFAIVAGLKAVVKASVEVEKSLAEINVVLGTSNQGIQAFGANLFAIAKKTGQSFYEVSEAAVELSRQGLGLNETLARTENALILTRLAGTGVVASVEAITAAMNGFQRAALTSNQVINKIIAVDQAFAVSGKDLAEAIKRVGSTAESAGVSFDELLAAVTAAQQITARGGAVIGNINSTTSLRLYLPACKDQER